MSIYVYQPSQARERVRYQLTLVLVIVNVVVFVLTYSISSNTISDYWALTLAQQNYAILNNGEWWRLFTSMWLHYDIVHIGSNMLGLLLFGVSLETFTRRWQYLVIYFAAGLAGNLASLAFLNPYDYSLGASGAIFGILAAAIIGRRALVQQNLCMAVIFVAAYVAASSSIPEVNNWAHIFGAVAGALLILAFAGDTGRIGRSSKQAATGSSSRFFASARTPVARIPCPYCRHIIPADALDCPYCNRPLATL